LIVAIFLILLMDAGCDYECLMEEPVPIVGIAMQLKVLRSYRIPNITISLLFKANMSDLCFNTHFEHF